jgi:hypothetical protein
MNKKNLLLLIFGIISELIASSQTTNIYTTSTTWTIPAHVYSVSVKAYGGGGGTGGQDCGSGCTNAASGNAGYVIAAFTVVPGNTVGIYPGGIGGNGSNNVTGTGGGAGGTASYAGYAGGVGGNAGSSGASGAGGGGGAATVVTINASIKVVAGGAAGGGGMANVTASGKAGNNTTSPNGTSNAGGAGTMPSGDGGGGGGGGGGQYGSIGGTVYATGGESAGNGGFIGGNQINGAASVTTNSNISWSSGGRIEITYNVLLPVNWLGFSANLQPNGNVVLNWSTTAEINSHSFIVQRSTDGNSWLDIATLAAVGNSGGTHEYAYTDKSATSKVNYYRIAEIDIDGQTGYSKTIVVRTVAGSTLLLFPNPVRNAAANLFLKNDAIVTIYNFSGMKLMEKHFRAGTSLLDVSSLAKGSYLLKAGADCIAFVVQ